jgi:microcystin-dependent protein
MPAHTHNFTRSYNDNGDPGKGLQVSPGELGPQTSSGLTTENIHNTGGGGSHNNMQPYIVTLFIQKIVTPYA